MNCLTEQLQRTKKAGLMWKAMPYMRVLFPRRDSVFDIASATSTPLCVDKPVLLVVTSNANVRRQMRRLKRFLIQCFMHLDKK